MKKAFTPLQLLMLFLVFTGKSFTLQAQPDLYKGNNAHSFEDVSGMNITKLQSDREKFLVKEIKILKRSESISAREKLLAMEKELASLRGNLSLPVENKKGAALEPADGNTIVTGDVISNGRIYNNPAATVKAVLTATEQRGSTAGKIWLLYIFSSNPAFPDSIRVLTSVNNGASWVNAVNGNLAPWDRLIPDDIDMELIENSSGQKYLWMVYTTRDSLGAGRTVTSGIVLRVPSIDGAFFTIRWPNSDTLTNRYYDIKITSDNAAFAGTAYTYIIASFDSLAPNGNWVNTQKYARCVDPYLLNPDFTYQPERFYWFSSPGPAGFQRRSYSDIAYFQNGSGGDSVIVSFSGVPDSSRIFFAKADIIGSLAGAPGASSFAGSDPLYKDAARISTNGNNNGTVMCVFRQLVSGNWNVKYFTSTNFGNFNTGTSESMLLGSPVNPNGRPDAVGRRNAGTHYFTFSTNSSSADSVHYLSVSSSGISSHIQKMNALDSISSSFHPKAGFTYANGDSCLVFYAGGGSQSIWAARGCSGEPIGIVNNSTPLKYELTQNYPNPFNPSTSIRYSIPVKGIVMISLYNMLGKEIAVLVNESKDPGNYILDFNASGLASGVYFYKLSHNGFSSVRKMILLK